MPTLRVHGVQFLADKKLRVHGVTFTGSPTTPTLRVHGVQFIGNAPLVLQPFADQTVEAFEVFTITAMVGATSPPPSGFVWRQISGPTVAFQDNGNSITVTAPAAVAGTTLVFGVTGVLGTSSSPEVTATRLVIPHLNWILGSDAVWKPMTRMQTL